MANEFILGWKDFMTKKFLAITFLPFIITFSLFLVIGIIVGPDFFQSILATPSSEWAQAHPFLTWLLTNSITHFLLKTIITTLGILAAILLSTALATFIMGFFTPTIIKEIHKRHYAYLPLEGGVGILEYLWLSIKIFLKFFALLLLSLLLYFIPLLNALALNIPFYYLFHSFLSLDVGGEIMRAKELEEILKKYRFRVMKTTGILYLITLLPLAGTLLQVYFVSVMAHLFFRIKAASPTQEPSYK